VATNSLYRRQPIRIGPRVLLALLGLTLVAPAAAKGECAHYVVARSHHVYDINRIELLSLTGQAAGSKTLLPESPARDEPCFGGMCSGAPILPLAPAPVAPLRLDQWMSIATTPTTPDPSLVSLVTEDPLCRPSEFVATIDHPPRSHFARAFAR